jgi:ribosomal protein L33
MTSLNSRQQYIIPYDSNTCNKEFHLFQYWSLNSHLDIKSPYAFKRGDLVEIVEVNTKENYILVLPATKDAEDTFLMVFASNDIPLSPTSLYEFSFNNCELITKLECEDSRNKFYTMLLGVKSTLNYASVNAYCRANRTKLTFHVGINNG